MDEATLTALKGSIAKWEAIVAGADSDRGATNCPLCQAFPTCAGCPVMAETEEDDCVSTPWEAWYALHSSPGFEALTDGLWAKTPRQKELAQMEVDFLKSLLPSTENP